jgi:membrane-associated phospholipid phosphatase
MKNKFWPSVILLVILLTALGFLRTSSFKAKEQDVIAELQLKLSPSAIRFFQVVSDSISFISLGIPAIYLMTGFIKKNSDYKRKGLMILLSIALAGSICAVIKRTVREPRPYEVDSRITQLSVGGSNSFPSGHTAEVSVAALAFSLILFRTPLSIVLSIAWALIMMISRIVLGVHNFTDIAGGFIAGCLGLLIMQNIFERMDKKDP